MLFWYRFYTPGISGFSHTIARIIITIVIISIAILTIMVVIIAMRPEA